jgi:hypothetical protein
MDRRLCVCISDLFSVHPRDANAVFLTELSGACGCSRAGVFEYKVDQLYGSVACQQAHLKHGLGYVCAHLDWIQAPHLGGNEYTLA